MFGFMENMFAFMKYRVQVRGFLVYLYYNNYRIWLCP